MKRVAFAHVNKIIDFETYQEAVDYIVAGWDKPWNFVMQKDNSISKPWKPFEPHKPFSFESDYENKLKQYEEKLEEYKKKFEQYEEQLKQYMEQYIWHTGNDGCTYCFGDKEVTEYWSVEVNIPYGKYNTGW